MWIALGLAGFYLVYRLEFRWYMVSIIKMGYSPMTAPMILLNPRAHLVIHGSAFLIFCTSTYCFFKANPWAMLLSPTLLFLSMIAHAQKQSARTDKVIRTAVHLQTSLERQGKKQADINEAVCIATLGEEGVGRGWDPNTTFKGRLPDDNWVLKEMVKSTILPCLGLLASRHSLTDHNGAGSSAFKQYEKDCQEIEWKIETALKHFRAKQAVS